MVLIVSSPEDEHGNAVLSQLLRLGVPALRMAAGELGSQFLYSICPQAEDFASRCLFSSLRTEEGEIVTEASSVTAIYWRRPLKAGESLMTRYPAVEELAAAESIAAFTLAVSAFPANMFPLGHPAALDQAENKLWQLRLAHDVGFNVPETMVANDAVALDSLLAKHAACVVKPLYHPVVYDSQDRAKVNHLLWCREFPSHVLRERLASAGKAQMLVQQAIKKTADWRITVLPQVTVCCEIDSSGLPPGEPDWRKKTLHLPHRIVDLPAGFEDLLRRFLARINLPVGYFDFAVTAEGVPFFLEMNPNAQWLWIEQMTGYSISEEVARALASIGS